MRICNRIIALTLTLLFTIFIAGCSGFFDKDNTPSPTPLMAYKPEVSPRLRWRTNIGHGAATNDYLKMNPAVFGNRIYTSSTDGYVYALNQTTGRVIWKTRLPTGLSTGPGVNNEIVVVANHVGRIYALDQGCGKILWQAQTKGNVIATPAVGNSTVVIKAVNGLTTAYSARTGHVEWHTQQAEPTLLLRGSSAPYIKNQAVIVGYANGNLAKYDLNQGDTLWTRPVSVPQGAFSIQRMIDIDADPLVYNQQIFVASYQGNIASLDWATGGLNWAHSLSSYTGMAVNSNATYITDASGNIYAFNRVTGHQIWQQNDLRNRVLSSPAIQGRYVVVGDKEGFAHWFNQADGRLAGRVELKKPVYADPIVDQNVLFMLTSDGTLSAYSIN